MMIGDWQIWSADIPSARWRGASPRRVRGNAWAVTWRKSPDLRTGGRCGVKGRAVSLLTAAEPCAAMRRPAAAKGLAALPA